ncbi:nuclear transport factor 2 family protein [Nocardioides zeae]|uniref:Nuclear transport factor 2 family protein n=1 Tax=Nocardioides imazamoxiresistens TaxID=3231893 RepID=A0ABU3PR05_9ACTN|nr:nuclear transport factor 2 family protein [Nocardioides zeae]MDT9591653.1 nuclear transport factor 2 family protein [Nocardioides zeae]
MTSTDTTGTTGTTHPVRALAERYFAAVNGHDWEALAAVLHPDVEVRHGMSLSTTGSEKAVRLLTAVVAQFEEHEDRPTRYVVDGDAAAVEIEFVGRTRAGAEVAFDAVDVIDTDGSRITRVVSWYDTAVVVPMIKGSGAGA